MFADFLCVSTSPIDTTQDLSGCGGNWYGLPLFVAGDDSDYGVNGSFTTTDTFPQGRTYYVSVEVDDVYTFYSNVYYGPPDSCSVDENPDDPWLFICAAGATSWMPAQTFALPDTVAPSAPTGLSANVGQTSVDLTWNTSTDNVAVGGYRIYRDGKLLGQTTGTSYVDTGLAPSTSYTYTVEAFDAAGNTTPAASVTAKTPKAIVCRRVLKRKAHYTRKRVHGHTRKVWHKPIYKTVCR